MNTCNIIISVVPYFVKKDAVKHIFKIYNHYVVSTLFWRFNLKLL